MKIIGSMVQSTRTKNRGRVIEIIRRRIFKAFLMILPLLGILSVDTIPAMENKENLSNSSNGQYRKNQTPKTGSFKISVDVNLITTDVTIEGKPLSRLSAEDFIIYDNTVAQEVTHFSYDQLPIAVALLIDRSGSVESFYPLLQISSFLTLRNLKPEDQIALFFFADSCTQEVELTTDRLSIAEKISKIQVGGGTNIHGALQETARYLSKNAPDRRRAIILVSDNRHRPPGSGLIGPVPDTPDSDVKETLNELLEASVALYSIRTRPSISPSYGFMLANKEKGQQASTGVAGTWLIKLENNVERKLDLKVEGTKVTGTISDNILNVSRTSDITDGKIEGDKISFYVEERFIDWLVKIPWTGVLVTGTIDHSGVFRPIGTKDGKYVERQIKGQDISMPIGEVSGDQIWFLSEPGVVFHPDYEPGDNDLKEIMEMTGGELFNVDAGNSLQKALSQAINKIRYRYTIGFNPTDPGEDGSYHKLLVKLAAQDRCPDCTLRTRKGYYTGAAAPILPQKEKKTVLKVSSEKTDDLLIQRAILTAATTELDLHDVPFTVQTAEQQNQNGQLQLTVQLNIDPAGIGFNTIDGLHACDLQIAVFFADRSGKISDYDWREITGRFNAEDYNRVIKEGIPYTTSYPVEVQDPVLKVVVYDAVNNSIGSKLITPVL